MHFSQSVKVALCGHQTQRKNHRLPSSIKPQIVIADIFIKSRNFSDNRKQAIPNSHGYSLSFYFLFQCIEFWGTEELAEGDLEAVAELFECDSTGFFTFAVQDAFDGGLGDCGDGAELIGSASLLVTQISYSVGDCFSGVHAPFLRTIYH